MHCSTLNTKGGMVSVAKNYLSYQNWGDFEITFIPTHYDTNKYMVMLYFGIRYIQSLFLVLFGNYKIAHLHTAERGSFWRKRFLMKTYHKFGIKVVMHHHAAEFEDFYCKCSEGQKEKIRQTLAEVDVNIVLSEHLVPMIKDKSPKAKVSVLYNAVNVYSSNPYNDTAKNILFLGRLGQRKGTYDLLYAINILDAQIDLKYQFYLCGDGDMDGVKAKIKELNISHRITHVGWTDGEMKKKFLANTLINVLPSYNEGLPMTILETMAYGIPNISTSIASIPEIIHDRENGFLICPGDVTLLAARIKCLIDNSELRKSFSKKSYHLILERFSLDHNIEELKSIYKKLV